MFKIHDQECQLLSAHLLDRYGIEIPKAKDYLFQTRLKDIIDEHRFDSFSSFYSELHFKRNEGLGSRVIECMTTNETSFFRDSKPFGVLEDRIIPDLIARRGGEAASHHDRFRIWSAGCSSGQEAYSIAILMDRILNSQELLTSDNLTIMGTDVCQHVLAAARKAEYSGQELGKGLADNLMSEYVEDSGNGVFRIIDRIRRMVVFEELNLCRPFEQLGIFDIILCRNVLIYLSDHHRARIIEQFHRMLRQGGVLIMGSSETLYHVSDDYEAIIIDGTTFYRKLAH